MSGAFGTFFGGILPAPYISYLEEVTGNAITLVPEPGTGALLLAGLALAGAAGRRRKT